MLDIIVVLIILIMTYIGYKKGFVHMLMRFSSYFLSLIFAWLLYPHVSKFLQATALASAIKDAVTNNYIVPNTPQIDAGTFGLPGIFDGFITSSLNPSIGSAAEGIAVAITALVLNIISIILVFVICKIIILFISKALNIVAKLPIISQFNKLGGIIIGFFQGVLIVYIAFALLTIFAPLQEGTQIGDTVNQSSISKQMYNNNIILNLFISNNNTVHNL